MVKVYCHYLSHTNKSLNFTESLKENNIQQMLNSLFEEDDDLSHEDDEKDDNDLSLIETDLGPWVYIDNSIPPIITRRNDSDNEEWDPEELLR